MKKLNQIKNNFDKTYENKVWVSEEEKRNAYKYFSSGALSQIMETKKVSGKYKEAAEEILEYLNKEKKNVSPNKNTRGVKFTDNIQRTIAARIREGFDIPDFKLVIDYKCHKWGGTEFAAYLRPSTLFSSKHFAEYLEESEGFKKPEQSKLDKQVSGLMG